MTGNKPIHFKTGLAQFTIELKDILRCESSKQCSYLESVMLYGDSTGRAEFDIDLDSRIELLEGLSIGNLLVKQPGDDIPQKFILRKKKVIHCINSFIVNDINITVSGVKKRCIPICRHHTV